MDLYVQNNLIYRAEGRFDNQVNFGQLCVKGWFGLDYVHSSDRLQAPLIRDSRDEALRPTTWDTAFDTVAKIPEYKISAVRVEPVEEAITI